MYVHLKWIIVDISHVLVKLVYQHFRLVVLRDTMTETTTENTTGTTTSVTTDNMVNTTTKPPSTTTTTGITKLPQTGQLWWPVPILLSSGILLFGIGLILRRNEN